MVIIGDGNVLLLTLFACEDVRLRACSVDPCRRIVSLDRDRSNINEEVACIGTLACIPVNLTTSPIRSSLSDSITTRPETEFKTSRGLRIRVDTCDWVQRFRLLESANKIAVDDPLNLLLLPVDDIFVVVVHCVIQQFRTDHVVVVLKALPVVVGLRHVDVVSNELIVDLVLDIR